LSAFYLTFPHRLEPLVRNSHVGDRVGRKSMLMIMLLVKGGATFPITLLPTFEMIGIWTPISLIVLRFLQGFAVGARRAARR
jgi:MFS family permease